jgi:hypothetical protein
LPLVVWTSGRGAGCSTGKLSAKRCFELGYSRWPRRASATVTECLMVTGFAALVNLVAKGFARAAGRCFGLADSHRRSGSGRLWAPRSTWPPAYWK